MLVYFSSLIASFILNLISRISKNKQKVLSIITAILGITIPILVCGLRYGVGTDFFNYQEWFTYYLTEPISLEKRDFGFSFMIKIIQLFSTNSQALFLISAIIINVLVMKFIKENTKSYELSYFLFIALYFYFSTFNITRQWIAISIVLFSLKFAYERKLVKYIIGLLIATTFHTTAILMLPIYFIINMKLNLKNIITLISIVFIIIGSFETIINLSGTMLGIGNTSHYLMYFEEGVDGGGANGYAYFIIGTLALLAILLVKNKYISDNTYGKQQILLLIIAIIITLYGIQNFIFARLQLYLIPIIVVCIPNILNTIKKRERKLVYFIIIILGLLYLYRCLLVNGGHPLPYYSIFNY